MTSISIKPYLFPAILLSSILGGALTGYLIGDAAQQLKPLGDIFLNLIFTAIVPLIFFSVSSAIAKSSSTPGKLGKIIFHMTTVFLFTGIVAACFAIVAVAWFPPAQGVYLSLPNHESLSTIHLADQLVGIFTVSDFSKLLSHENILALIIFSILVGLATASAKENGTSFTKFLLAGEDVFMRVFSFIMYYAPIGFFAYFAVLVSELGPKIMTSYLRVSVIYYLLAIIYFVVALSGFAYLAGRMKGLKLFWGNVFIPTITALATCSSAASIPANLTATKAMRVPADIFETTIPLGAIIHKDGSVIGGIIKIAFLFGLFHLSFSGTSVLLTALGVSLLVGTVMGAIPSGGMLGELLILSIYGLPPSALIAIAAISIIIDPIATMISVTSNCVSSMLIARLVEGKSWLSTSEQSGTD